ncbi:Carbohydrate sulfotransferase 15 [Holothuria leucospilota]|uniref:Carbohydrate sulfotransferase 15 n=1 Tax=Holothuria leucospilota TaxID=206669 RepID=A0A9Q1BPM9_HOLLE|nr:Carbohydrate sulfotransferase 15 [Holothuria leucospilota]
MNLFHFFANIKQSFGDNVFPVKLVPAEGNRNWCLCIKAKRHLLKILLLVVVTLSATLNVFLLMKYGIKIEERKTDSDKLEHTADDGVNPPGMVRRSQGVKFVEKVTPDKEFIRIQSLAKEIPAAKLDAGAMRAIRAVYNPQKYKPEYTKKEYQNKMKGVINENSVKDKKSNQGNEEKDPEEEGEKRKVMDIVVKDENGGQRIKFWTKRRPVPPDLYQVAPDIFDMVPSKFETGLKNPCWRSRGDQNWELHCLPYFFLIGMPKCGTSDLWHKIIQHPQVMLLVKEPHWWSRSRIGVRRQKIPFSEYLKLPQSLYSEIQQGHNNVIYGDGSASTMWDNRGWQQFFPTNTSEPPFVVADIIREILPDAKLIIILRDPIERLYSDYLFMRQVSNPSPKDFHHRVLRSIKSYEKCREQRSLRYCSYEDNPEEGEVRVRIGFYSLFLREWTRLYPIDQIAILELTQWSNYCMDLLPQIYLFLELDALEENQIQEICRLRRMNENTQRRNAVGDMLPETRSVLENLYRPFNADLTKLLGNDIFEWS